MVTKQTKTGKTMFGTTHEGKEYWSLEKEAVDLLEKGEVSKVVLTPKDNINFVGLKGRAFVNNLNKSNSDNTHRLSIRETLKGLRESIDILKALVDGLDK